MPTEETGKSFCLLLGIYHFGAEPALLSPPTCQLGNLAQITCKLEKK